MQLKASIKIFFLPLLLLPALSGCSAVRNINFYSTSQEIQLGQSLDKEIHKQFQILPDARVDTFLALRGHKLVEASDRKDLAYHFFLVKSEEINAFAIPGGFCYVNLGLFRQSDTENELISVLAHEINHVVHRHSMKRLSQMQIVDAGTQALIGNANSMTGTVTNLFTSIGLLNFSREDEREADRDGLLTMYRAGYDPQGMVEMFEMLKKGRETGEPGRWEKLFSTHPITDERIRNASQLIAQLPPIEGMIVDSPEWKGTIEYLREKYPPPKKEDKEDKK